MTYKQQYIQYRTTGIWWTIAALLNLVAGIQSGESIHLLVYLICVMFAVRRYWQMAEAKDRIILDDFLNDDK